MEQEATLIIQCVVTKLLCGHFKRVKTDAFLMEDILDLALMIENGQFAMMHPKDRGEKSNLRCFGN